MPREKTPRNDGIFKAWVAGRSVKSLAEEHGISMPSVHVILKRYRKTTPEQERAELVAREIEMLDELRQLGMGIARDSSDDGRLAGGKFAIDAGKELRRMLGLDAAIKAQVETTVRYTLEGVPPEDDV